MQTVGKFNTISEDLMKSIPSLEVGQAVTFEMLTGVKNNDPDEKERQMLPWNWKSEQDEEEKVKKLAKKISKLSFTLGGKNSVWGSNTLATAFKNIPALSVSSTFFKRLKKSA